MLYSIGLQKGWRIEDPMLRRETPTSFLSVSHTKSAALQAYVSPLFFPLFTTFALRVENEKILSQETEWS